MKIIVEPHPDDAFLSLGWHLEHVWKAEKKLIITVYADTQRAKEAAAYASAVGAEHICLCLTESDMSSSSAGVAAIPELRSILTQVVTPFGDETIFPLGLQHPDHLRVSATRLADSLRYVDTPYQTKQKLAGTLLEKIADKRIVSLCYPPSRKWRHIPIFKSQSKFFYFNAGLKDSLLPEMVVANV